MNWKKILDKTLLVLTVLFTVGMLANLIRRSPEYKAFREKGKEYGPK